MLKKFESPCLESKQNAPVKNTWTKYCIRCWSGQTGHAWEDPH